MSAHLICPSGHRFDMAASRFARDGARCPKCGAVTVKRVKPKQAPCPAAPGCPQTPDCGGCAYEPAGHMMAMQEGQTAQEAMRSTEAEEHFLDVEESPHVEVIDLAEVDCTVDPADLDADAAAGEAQEATLLDLFGPADPELDDPDSPRHQVAV